VQILVLSAYDDQEYILELLASGAAGYLVKGEAPERIIEAVRGVAQGERGWVSPQVAITLKKMREAPRDRKTITYRELEILRLVVQKKTNKEMASTLGLSEEMVSRHLSVIMNKLGVDTREAAVVIALREGWI
jgi:DNA-binding NarL/FixJ family response regulator